MTDTDTDTGSDPCGAARVDRIVAWYVGTTTVVAVALVALVARIELAVEHGPVNWPLFAILAMLLVATETQSRTWIRFGDDGVVTASWTFAYSLMLLGSPLGAILVMAVATVAAEIAGDKPLRKILFNTSQISMSLAMGAMVLFAFEIHGPVFADGYLPTSRGIAIMISGALVFGTNGIVLCKLLAILEDTTFLAMMRDSFALSMSADAAMLAIAPILVSTTQRTLLMLPLVGVATFFVYQTARHAIQQGHEADHDSLTQLLNRRAFTNRLDNFVTAETGNPRIAGVFVLDLDRFKEINDRLGHRTGDHVLQAFAQRLLDVLPDSAIVARLGGDEFAVVVEGPTGHHVDAAAARLHADLSRPLHVDGFPISAGSSIGVAHYPAHGHSPSGLLHAADIAMYRAKRFRSGVERYETLGATQQKGRVALLGDLTAALERKEFHLHYQPQVDVASGEVASVEALLRWEHPEHGPVAPDEFIALAEQTDLIGPLTDAVLDQALQDIHMLPDHVQLAVNVSARNLQDRHFAQSVFDHLARHHVAPERLELEITESSLALDPERTAGTIDHLRGAGVRIAIDDFGTGYSSFATLRELTVDRIKIDRSFITHAAEHRRDARIAKSLVELAHRLGLGVVAEGVETPAGMELLREVGCDIAQGYFVGRPAPIGEIAVCIAAAHVERITA